MVKCGRTETLHAEHTKTTSVRVPQCEFTAAMTQSGSHGGVRSCYWESPSNEPVALVVLNP